MHLVFFLFLACRVASAGISLGATAPDFTLRGTDGKEYELKTELKTAEAAIVIFIGTKCPYSTAYNDRYNELFDTLKKLPKRVVFFVINSNVSESMHDVQKHAAQKQYKFNVLKDPEAKVADGFAAERTPEAFLLDKQGKIIYRGRIDDDTEGLAIKRKDLFVALEEHLSGKPITLGETKALGCSIKRK